MQATDRRAPVGSGCGDSGIERVQYCRHHAHSEHERLHIQTRHCSCKLVQLHLTNTKSHVHALAVMGVHCTYSKALPPMICSLTLYKALHLTNVFMHVLYMHVCVSAHFYSKTFSCAHRHTHIYSAYHIVTQMTKTHTHTHAHTQPHTHTHTHTTTHTHTHSNTPTHTHSQ